MIFIGSDIKLFLHYQLNVSRTEANFLLRKCWLYRVGKYGFPHGSQPGKQRPQSVWI